jgi:signal peptidase I
MKPNFHQGQRLLVNKATYYLHTPERGDVIVFHPPSDGQADYIKRVVGLPGESVEIREGKVYIYLNGQPFTLDEGAFVEAAPDYRMTLRKIPENQYFVLGDNRNNSNDSHNGWTVQEEDIVGKAWILMWPPDEWGLVPHFSSLN